MKKHLGLPSVISVSVSLILIFAGAGCTKKEDSGGGASEKSAAQSDKNVNIASVGETMAYDKTELTVPAGQDITLTFKNNSTTLQHNWVLTQPGKDNEVGLEGIKAGLSKGFVPDNPAVLAHTKLVDANGSDTITFKAPPAGDYPYICTNAGHHMVMKGTLHSK